MTISAKAEAARNLARKSPRLGLLTSGTAIAALVAAGAGVISPISVRSALAADECTPISEPNDGNTDTIACDAGPFASGITYGNSQTQDPTQAVFVNSQVTGGGVLISSNQTGESIFAETQFFGVGPAPSITNGAGGFDGDAGFQLVTSGNDSPVTFNHKAGTITGGDNGLGHNGVLLQTSGTGSNIVFTSADKTTISATTGSGVVLNATKGGSIGDGDGAGLNGKMVSTQTVTIGSTVVGIGTGLKATTSGGNGSIDLTQGSTGEIAGTGAGFTGSAVGTGSVTLTTNGKVDQTSKDAFPGGLGGLVSLTTNLGNAPSLLPVGLGGVATGSGAVTLTQNAGANSVITQVGAIPEINVSIPFVGNINVPRIEGAGILAVNTGTGAATATGNGTVNATGIGVGAITLSGNADATANIGGTVNVTGATGQSILGLATGGLFNYTVGGLAISGNGTAAVNIIEGQIPGDGDSKTAGVDGANVGALAVVLGGDEDAKIVVGRDAAGIIPAANSFSTVYGQNVGLMAFNVGKGNATIDANQLDKDGKLSVTNSGGTGMITVTLGEGDAIVDTGEVNANLSGKGGIETLFSAILSGDAKTIAAALPDSGSGAIAFAAGGGDAKATNYGKIVANDGAFGSAAISIGGEAHVTAMADIDPPDIGMFPFSVGNGPAIGDVVDGVTVDSNYVGILAGNILGNGSVLVNVGDNDDDGTGGHVTSGGVGVFLLKQLGADGPDGNVINVRKDSSVVGDWVGIGILAGLPGSNNSAVVNNDGLIQGNSASIVLPFPLPPIPVADFGVITAYTSGTLTINNNAGATIQGDLSAAAQIGGFGDTDADLGAFETVVAAAGGATTISNDGALRGRVLLFSGDNNTINNANLWNTGGVNFMGFGDDDAVNNGGIVRTHLLTFFTDLENFNNQGGQLTYQDSAINDVTTIDGNFNGSADPSNQESLLSFDATLTPDGFADLLLVGGDVTDVTTVDVRDLDNGPGLYTGNDDAILFALVGGDTDSSNFTTNGGIDKGLFRYDAYLRDTPIEPLNLLDWNEWVLASTLDREAFEFPVIQYGAQNLWYASTGTWLDRTADLRSAFTETTAAVDLKNEGAVASMPGSVTPGIWGRVFGGTSERDMENQSLAPEGLQGPNPVFEDTFNQDYYGFMAGVDFGKEGVGANGQNTAWLFGIMGGYTGSNLDFDGSDTDVDYQQGSIGAYVTYLNGGFFADAAVKADFGNIDYSTQFGGDDSGDYTSIGVIVDTGYRYNGASGWFIEPKATLAYVNTDFDDLEVLGTGVEMSDGDSLRGRLGVRVGGTMMRDANLIEPYIEASLWNEFDGDYDAGIVSNGFNLPVNYDAGGLSGEVAAGANIINVGNGWNAFAKGAVQFGEDDLLGFSGNLGFRKNW